jgi:hypothetical protein
MEGVGSYSPLAGPAQSCLEHCSQRTRLRARKDISEKASWLSVLLALNDEDEATKMEIIE